MLPKGSYFPAGYDHDFNLYLVHDALRLTLARDYKPGDQRIVVDGSKEMMGRFPKNGIITLTDQTANDKSVSFHYSSKGNSYFEGLEILPGCKDAFKAKKETVVTQSLVAEHQTAIKDSVLALERYIGTVNDTSAEPGVGSLIARINFLKKLVYAPKAWFIASKTVGMVPFTVEFSDQSRASGSVDYHWSFGDGTKQSGSPVVSKTFMIPGVFDVTLTVTNEYGQDTVTFASMIQARIAAPEEAKIEIQEAPGQKVRGNTIRARTNQLITLTVVDSGESKNGGKVVDPVVAYTWNLADDLPHSSYPVAKASFGEGGMYDMSLRVTTEFGAYRITNFKNALDIVEKTNLWLWTNTDKGMRANEYGLISETFKTKLNAPLSLKTDDSFLENGEQKHVFHRNNTCAPRNKASGLGGTAALLWASGRGKNQPPSFEKIFVSDYNAFEDVYNDYLPVSRPWNWLSFVTDSKAYIFMGRTESLNPMLNQQRMTLDLPSLSASNDEMQPRNYINGAQSLGENLKSYGQYSTAWRGVVGYVLHENSMFYKTDGVIGEPFMNLVRLPDVPGSRSAGELVALSGGIYILNNSGTVMAYRPNSGVWETSPLGTFRGTQDRTFIGAEDLSNTLVVTSDGEHRAYVSFDYSPNAFVKFNETDLTFTKLRARPQGDQWQACIF